MGKKHFYDLFIPETRDQFKKGALEVFKQKGSFRSFVNLNLHKDGRIVILETSGIPILDDQGNLLGYRGADLDVSIRKKMEEELQKTLLFQQQLMDVLPLPVFYKDAEGRYQGCNHVFEELCGTTKEQISGKTVYELSPKEIADVYYAKDQELFQHPGIQIYESVIKDLQGIIHNVILHKATFLNSEGKVGGLIGAILDITDRKKMEEERIQSEERYRSIFENIQEGIIRSDADNNILVVNPSLARILGYDSPEEFIATVSLRGEHLDVNPEDTARIIDLLETDGFVKGYELQQYKKDGSIVWISLSVHPVRDEKGQILYYDGFHEDITERRRKIEQLQRYLTSTIQAMVATLESRDPYTAGHQRRVADLARAIAEEMGFSADRIEGLRMAASIHDIGRISIPAEILCKPSKLDELEYELVKVHSQSGYDILKDIEFPWPVARIILEHHERFNGTGYPQGLVGDQALLESRILALADVVEAMSSYRPYRPALGIGVAFNEITENKGILYDPEVVDACFRLFYEKGYQLID